MLKSFWRNESGATSIEYAVMAGLIAVVIVAAVRQVGVNLNANYYQKVANNLT